MRSILIPSLFVSLFFVPSVARAAPLEWRVAGQAGAAIESPSLSVSTEVNVHAGRWGGYVKLEWNPWFATQDPDAFKPGAVNIGVGGEVRYFGGRARTAVALGPSILAFRTQIDEAGEVGFFFDVVPIGLRFPITRCLDVRLDPLSWHVVAPVLGGIPLVLLQYRTSAGIEWRFH